MLKKIILKLNEITIIGQPPIGGRWSKKFPTYKVFTLLFDIDAKSYCMDVKRAIFLLINCLTMSWQFFNKVSEIVSKKLLTETESVFTDRLFGIVIKI